MSSEGTAPRPQGPPEASDDHHQSPSLRPSTHDKALAALQVYEMFEGSYPLVGAATPATPGSGLSSESIATKASQEDSAPPNPRSSPLPCASRIRRSELSSEDPLRRCGGRLRIRGYEPTRT